MAINAAQIQCFLDFGVQAHRANKKQAADKKRTVTNQCGK